jgi:hypothetical protein
VIPSDQRQRLLWVMEGDLLRQRMLSTQHSALI